MLTGIMLLYVGATLGIDGIWLIGQARAARLSQAAAIIGATEADASDAMIAEGGSGTAVRERQLDPPLTGSIESHFTFMQPKEIAVINFFTGGVGVVVAVLFATIGAIDNNLSDIANAAFIMLFGFTYLFLGFNQFLNAGNHVFGWFDFFVAITAVPTGVYTLRAAHGNAADIWLGVNWFIWAGLWFSFFLLLTMERPIVRQVGWATIAVAVATCWAFGYTLLQGVVAL